MLKYYRRQFNFVCALADVLALASAFLLAFWMRRDIVPRVFSALSSRPMFPLQDYFPVFLLCSLVSLGALIAVKAYKQSPAVPLSSMFFLNVRAVLSALLVTLALAYLLKMTFLSRLFLILFVASFLVLSTILKHGVAVWFRKGMARGKYLKVVFLVGANSQARALAARLLHRPELGIRIRGFLSHQTEDTDASIRAMEELGMEHLGNLSSLSALLEREVVDGVIFCVGAGRLASMEELFLMCEDLGIDTLMAANLFPHLIAQVHLERLEELPLLRFTTVPHDQIALFLKRAFDLSVSFAALALLSPLMALISLLVKTTSPGPVLFKQERVGLNGRRFLCLKFRTMVQNAEELKGDLEHLNEVSGPVFKIRNDPRVTPIGRVLRKISLDELPQLWNVLLGEMSLVGPRPPIPGEVEKYQRWQRRRLSMRPGITCLWQISGRSELDFDTWMKLDLQYIDHWSLALDFIILIKTVPAVLSARGAA